jgi:hypothetical protein
VYHTQNYFDTNSNMFLDDRRESSNLKVDGAQGYGGAMCYLRGAKGAVTKCRVMMEEHRIGINERMLKNKKDQIFDQVHEPNRA